ncbi:hypothetical protein ACFLTB_02120 [Chloroflexota bacterium]
MVKGKIINTIELEIIEFLRRNDIPLQRYLKLPNNLKEAAKNLLCVPTHPVSHQQRKDLYIKLCIPDAAGRESIDPTDFMPPDALENFFTPINLSETLTEYEKY